MRPSLSVSGTYVVSVVLLFVRDVVSLVKHDWAGAAVACNLIFVLLLVDMLGKLRKTK